MNTVPMCRSKYYLVGRPGIAVGVALLMAPLANCIPVQRRAASQFTSKPVITWGQGVSL